jgi:hypothetical protein
MRTDMARVAERRPYPLFIYFLVLLMMIVVEAVLVSIGLVSLPFIGPLALTIPFFIVIGLWLGSWGLLAGYIGWFLARLVTSGLAMTDPQVIILAILSAFQGLWLIAAPSAAISLANADLGISRASDLMVFVIGAILADIMFLVWAYLSELLSAIIMSGTIPTPLLVDPVGVIESVAYAQLIPLFLTILIITPILLKILTPRVRYTILYLRPA